MRALLLTALLLLAPGAAWSQSLDDAPPIYVAGVYDQLANGGDYDPPDALYTPRLLALWEDMRRDAGGEVGRLDFFYWTNAQDWTLSDLSIGSTFVDGHEDRMTVTAAFRNGDRAERIHFHFEKTGGRWRLDDVSSGGADPWTLSLLLKYGRTGGD
ncbi:MAG: YbjP/YqhG family protein [Caulobacter sp.]|nr:YbjP/YqhG family protein [Caulobacter sp.]